MIKEVIIITINSEEHLGETLKKQCIDYINNLELENKKINDNWNRLLNFLEDQWTETQDIWYVKIIEKMKDLQRGRV